MTCELVTLCHPTLTDAGGNPVQIRVFNAGTPEHYGKLIPSGDPYLGDINLLVECPNLVTTGLASIAVEQGAQDGRLDALEAEQIVQDATVTALDTATTNNFATVASDQATQDGRLTALETAIASDMTYKGGYDAAANTPDLPGGTGNDHGDGNGTAIAIGDTYKVDTTGSFFGTTLNVGDTIISEVDNPTTLDDWTILSDSAGTGAQIAALQAADTALSTAINDLDTDLQGQITANDNDIASLQTADTTLQSNINTEQAARFAGDNANATAIGNNSTAIASNDTDIAALQAADTALQTSINNEAATRAANDAVNANAISAEVINRINADQLHDAAIVNLQTQDATHIAQIAALQASLVGGVNLKGGYDPVANTPDLPAGTGVDNGDGNGTTITTGDLYKITGDGTFFGQPVESGDSIVAIVDNPTTAADWIIELDTIGEATEATLGSTRYATEPEVSAGSATDRSVTPASLKAAGMVRAKSFIIGNGTDRDLVIPHGLGSTTIAFVTYFDIATGLDIKADLEKITPADPNNVTVKFLDPPPLNSVEVVIGVI